MATRTFDNYIASLDPSTAPGKSIVDQSGAKTHDGRAFFYPTEQITHFTITAAMLFTEVTMNSASDLNVTLGSEIEVGKGVMIRRVGAGKPVFVAGANQSVETYEIADDSDIILFERLPDVGGVERYRVTQKKTG